MWWGFSSTTLLYPSLYSSLSLLSYSSKKFSRSVLLAGGFDYYKSGLLTGQLIERVIKGEKPTDIGMTLLDEASLELYINLDVAEKLGIAISDDMIKNAAYVIKDGKNTK